MQIFVKDIAGKSRTVDVSSRDLISSLKSHIESCQGIPAKRRRLVWSSRQLADEKKFADYIVELVAQTARWPVKWDKTSAKKQHSGWTRSSVKPNASRKVKTIPSCSSRKVRILLPLAFPNNRRGKAAIPHQHTEMTSANPRQLRQQQPAMTMYPSPVLTSRAKKRPLSYPVTW